MSRITKRKELTMATLRNLREKMGSRPMDEPLHASDIYQCARKTVASRLFGEPALTREDIEIMFPGYALQIYCWGDEAPGEEWNDALFSIDGSIPNAVLEYKTTGAYSNYLEDPQPAWVDRTKAYCVVHKVTDAYILCYSFGSRRFHEWHVEYTPAEIKEEERWLKQRIPFLQGYIDRGELPPVTERRYNYECKYCKFKTHEDTDCKPLLKAAGMRITPPVKGKAK